MTSFLNRPDGERLAYLTTPGDEPTIVWLGGFKSEMTATKATHLAAWAERTGHGLLRFDYFGHGASSGDFRAGTIGRWIDDALAAIDTLTMGRLVLVGSSMGGWIASHVALKRADRIAGMVYIAPALDMTEALLWDGMDAFTQATVMIKGEWARPSAYDPDPYPITRRLIEEGRDHLLLDGPIAIDVAVRILHGQADLDVPWQHSLKLIDALTGRDVTLTLVKGGDHRLSTPPDLTRLQAAVEDVLES